MEFDELERRRGDTRPETLTVKEASALLDVSACSFVMTLNTEKKPADTSNEIGQIIGAPVAGSLGDVAFPFTLALANQLGNVYFDVEMTDAQGYISTINVGKIKFKQDITK